MLCCDGTKEWFINDKWHRDDGPAIEHANGSEMWYKNGVIHRDDGPAIIWPGQYETWVLDDAMQFIIFYDGCDSRSDATNASVVTNI